MAQIIGTLRDDNLVGTRVTNSPTCADDSFGLSGNDRMDGRSGDDRLFGGPGEEKLLGSVGGDGRNGLTADINIDAFGGASASNQLHGGSENA